MKMLETETDVAKAVSFLSSRVSEQSRADSVPVSDIELRQLAFSEGTASAEMLVNAAEFDATHDSAKFEAKIAKLLRRAYRYDVQHGMELAWREHLTALCHHDVYVLVMVDQAKIPRLKPNFLATFFVGLAGRRFVCVLPDLAMWLVAALGFVYFFILPITSGSSGVRLFGTLAERLIPNENARLAVFVFWLALVCLESRRPWKKYR